MKALCWTNGREVEQRELAAFPPPGFRGEPIVQLAAFPPPGFGGQPIVHHCSIQQICFLFLLNLNLFISVFIINYVTWLFPLVATIGKFSFGGFTWGWLELRTRLSEAEDMWPDDDIECLSFWGWEAGKRHLSSRPLDHRDLPLVFTDSKISKCVEDFKKAIDSSQYNNNTKITNASSLKPVSWYQPIPPNPTNPPNPLAPLCLCLKTLSIMRRVGLRKFNKRPEGSGNFQSYLIRFILARIYHRPTRTPPRARIKKAA